jgi:hypothetical protein
MSRRWKGPVAIVSNPRFTPGSPEHDLYKDKQRKYYYDNADVQRGKAAERMRRRRERNQQWVLNYMSGKSCEMCGVSDSRVLTFDHRDDTDKYANVSNMVTRGLPWGKLVEEVAKCRILCHNCHMIRTFEHMGGTYHSRMTPCTDVEFRVRYGDILS